ELLGEHASYEEVRPGHPSERKGEICPLPDRVSVTGRAADQKDDGQGCPISPVAQPGRELAACQGIAAFVESHDRRSWRDRRQQQLAFTFFELIDGKRLPTFDLLQDDRPFDASDVNVEEAGHRIAPRLTDRGDHDLHGRTLTI